MSDHVHTQTAAAVEAVLTEEHVVPVAGTVGYLRRTTDETPYRRRIDSLILKGPVPVVHPPTVMGPIGRVEVWLDGDTICARGHLAVRGVRPPVGFTYPVGLDLGAAHFTFEDAAGNPIQWGDPRFADEIEVSIANEAILFAVVVDENGPAWPGAQLEVLPDDAV